MAKILFAVKCQRESNMAWKDSRDYSSFSTWKVSLGIKMTRILSQYNSKTGIVINTYIQKNEAKESIEPSSPGKPTQHRKIQPQNKRTKYNSKIVDRLVVHYCNPRRTMSSRLAYIVSSKPTRTK